MKITPLFFLILAILLLLTLSSILFLQKPFPISSPTELESLKNNQLVQVSGKVTKESNYYNSRILTLDNSLILECSSCQSKSLKEKTIIAKAKLQDFQNKKTMKVLEIKIK